MFSAFEEGYLCLLKTFLLSIHRPHLMQFLREMYMEKVLQELFWVHLFGHLHPSNSTKFDETIYYKIKFIDNLMG